MTDRAADLVARARSLRSADDAVALYRDWAETYDRDVFDTLGVIGSSRIADLLAQHHADLDAPVLDLGCGTGVVAAHLRDHGFTVIDGWDISPEMLEVAARRGSYRTLRVVDLTKPVTAVDDHEWSRRRHRSAADRRGARRTRRRSVGDRRGVGGIVPGRATRSRLCHRVRRVGADPAGRPGRVGHAGRAPLITPPALRESERRAAERRRTQAHSRSCWSPSADRIVGTRAKPIGAAPRRNDATVTRCCG